MSKLNVVDIAAIPENDYEDTSIQGFENYIGKTVTEAITDPAFNKAYPRRRFVPYPLGLITADFVADRLTVLYDEQTEIISDRSYMG